VLNGADGGAPFLNIVNPLLVEYGFKFPSELGPAQRFSQKIALESFILQVVRDCPETLLAVNQRIYNEALSRLKFMERVGWVWHVIPLLRRFWFVELSISMEARAGSGD
jgi:hypothetical protein